MRKWMLFIFMLLACSSHSYASVVQQEQLFVIENFSYNNNYYISLSNDSCFCLQKVLIKKATGWFDSDEYGNPAAGWLPGDRIILYRTGAYDYPFQMQNLDAMQQASAVSVNIEMRAFEDINNKLQAVIDRLDQIKTNTDYIRSDVNYIRHH